MPLSVRQIASQPMPLMRSENSALPISAVRITSALVSMTPTARLPSLNRCTISSVMTTCVMAVMPQKNQKRRLNGGSGVLVQCMTATR